MFGNAIYSLTNTIPVGYESTAPESCGNSLMASSEGAIRGMWFWGKYTMVPYELFIIAASIVTLKTGSINVPWKYERAAHAGCIATGLLVFIGFWATAGQYNAEYLETSSYTVQQGLLAKYDTLVETFVQVWLGLLGIMVAMWVYQRMFLFEGLKKQWDTGLTEAEEQWDRDLWADDEHTRFQRANKRRLLDVIEEGYLEIVKPLEPYVATYIIFGVPAILMATSWCGGHSEAATPTVNCQHLCEMVLALRTLVTVGVYFSDAASREQLCDVRKLRLRVWHRMRPSAGAGPDRARHARVTYIKEDEVRIIPSREDEVSTEDHVETNIDISYAEAGV